jgi:hypothetical protein
MIALMIILARRDLRVAAQPLMYNGWRHFYFLYGAVAFSGSWMRMLYNFLKNSRAEKIAGAGALACSFSIRDRACGHHPYQYAYYNELASDVRTGTSWTIGVSRSRDGASFPEPRRNPALPLVLGAGRAGLFSLNQAWRFCRKICAAW